MEGGSSSFRLGRINNQDSAQKEMPKRLCPRLPLGWSISGGIRLDPSSAALWAGLGTCAKQADHQEYAFTRSLQLDPKSAHVWAALGRLYMESGARSLADTCFTQARSQEPADSATWAAMGALAGLSATGGSRVKGGGRFVSVMYVMFCEHCRPDIA